MTSPLDTRIIMMVAQRPFEVDWNQFCKLVPLIFVDGSPATASEFPNDGEIWWMLTAMSAPLAEPGRLLAGTLENAVRYEASDPDASRFQVKRDAISDLHENDAFEIIDLSADAIESIQDIVSTGFQVELQYRPAPPTLLRWRSKVYGPFAASSVASGGRRTAGRWSFLPLDQAEMTIYCFEEAEFTSLVGTNRLSVRERVSLTSQRRAETRQLDEVSRELVLPSGFQQALGGAPTKLVIEPLNRKLVRYAKQCLTRKKRQNLSQLLDELAVTGQELPEPDDLIMSIARAKSAADEHDESLQTVASALVQSGLLGEDRIEKAEAHFGEQYVERQMAALQARVEEALTAKRLELRETEHELQSIKSRLQAEEASRRSELDEELEQRRQASITQLKADRQQIEEQKSELDRQEQLLKANLEKVVENLQNAGTDVVNQFLTIAPLLGVVAPGLGKPEPSLTEEVSPRPTPSALAIPQFAQGPRRQPVKDLEEEEFFDRFLQVVDGSGFHYRQLDLKRFHVSVKCGDLTVVGGDSGTGKSSLPILYSRALLGEELRGGRPGCLMVNVNPSWMDSRDLLGHLNTLDGQFYPAESGLFEALAFASEESRHHGALAGINVVCLDEMNLAQVEHYFSDFMMVLERDGDDRRVKCFSPDVVSESCPFRAWSSLSVSPSTRFVGTVNYDETTRVLSKRMLDRVNLIRLRPAPLPSVEITQTAQMAHAAGRMVTLSDYERWLSVAALPANLGALLDELRPHLDLMGCSLSPRAYGAMCRFVASAQPLIPDTTAFDIQIAQRIAPQITSLITQPQVDALDEVVRLLQQSDLCAFDETMPMLDEAKQAAVYRPWDTEGS